jgi:hypothetical protein
MTRKTTQLMPRRSMSALFLRLAWRFVAGHHLDGRRRSDATFLCDGTQGEAGWWGTGRESRWCLLAGWKRAGLRLAVAVALVGLWRWREVTEWALALVLGPLAGFGLWRCVLAVRHMRHRTTVERPMAAALAPFLGVPPRTVEAGLDVDPGFADAAGGEHVAAVELPDQWAAVPDQKTRVEQVIQARLGVSLKYAWRTSSYPMVVNVTRAPVPPASVPFAEYRDEMEACPDGKVLLGVTADATRRYWDTASEDPHIAVHGGSRRGKTTFLLVTAGQVIRQWDRSPLPADAPECAAGRVTAIDPKRVSLTALAGVPGVDLVNDPRDIEGMWAAVRRFRELVDERYEVLTADPTAEFRRSVLILDEVSQLSGMWARHWKNIKERSDPAVPPVWDDVASIVWMGAQASAHAIVAGQRLDYAILGGMIGSFGLRMLAGYQPTDYARLVGVPPYQQSQKRRGRFLVYAGGELDWTQLVFAEPGEVRSWLLEARQDATDVALSVVPATGDLIQGLAAGAEYLGLSEAAFRKRRERGGSVPGEFRVGNQPAWKPADLDRWAGRETERIAS